VGREARQSMRPSPVERFTQKSLIVPGVEVGNLGALVEWCV
jgi:hypothetical protein